MSNKHTHWIVPIVSTATPRGRRGGEFVLHAPSGATLAEIHQVAQDLETDCSYTEVGVPYPVVIKKVAEVMVRRLELVVDDD